MKFRFLLGIAIMAIISGISAQAGTVSFADLLKRKVNGESLKIAYGSDPDQFGELWLPAGPGPHPVAIAIHGGCWQESLPGTELTAYIAADLQRSGIAVWNLEYRRLGGKVSTGYPEMFLDVGNGIDYLRKIAPTYKLDLSRVAVIGHSAGGHLALWATARGNIGKDSPLYNADPLKISVVVTLAGINDLEAYRETGADACGGPGIIDRVVNGTKRKNPYVDTSPAMMLPLGIAQVIVSGTLDPIVPAPLARSYAAKAKNAGDKVEVVEFNDAGHFELIDPQSAAWAKIKPIILERLRTR